MFKYLCNKCRAEIDEYSLFIITVDPPRSPTHKEGKLVGQFALCRSCTEKLHRFIEKGGADE